MAFGLLASIVLCYVVVFTVLRYIAAHQAVPNQGAAIIGMGVCAIWTVMALCIAVGELFRKH